MITNRKPCNKLSLHKCISKFQGHPMRDHLRSSTSISVKFNIWQLSSNQVSLIFSKYFSFSCTWKKFNLHIQKLLTVMNCGGSSRLDEPRTTSLFNLFVNLWQTRSWEAWDVRSLCLHIKLPNKLENTYLWSSCSTNDKNKNSSTHLLKITRCVPQNGITATKEKRPQVF